MNDIRHEVDAFGGVIEQPEQKRISRFKQIFSIGMPQRQPSEPAQPSSIEMADLSSIEDRAELPQSDRDGMERNSLNSLISEGSTFEDSKSQFEPMANRVEINDNEQELGIARVPKLNKTYMRTPCGHCYHIPCLKKWMDIRLECPTCRQRIPQIAED